jgi:hypothetical protein
VAGRRSEGEKGARPPVLTRPNYNTTPGIFFCSIGRYFFRACGQARR